MLSLLSVIGAFAALATAQQQDQSDVETLYHRRIPFILQTYPQSTRPVQATLDGW